MKAFLFIAAVQAAAAAAAAQPAVVVQQQAANVTFVPTTHVVTKFAVPVDVPKFASPVAPISNVQYGTNSTATPRGDIASIEKQIAELKSMLLEAVGSGRVTGLSLPSAIRKNCTSCHSGSEPKGGLDLSTLDKFTPKERLGFIGRITTDDLKRRMPPPASSVKVTAEDLGVMIQELTAGADLPEADVAKPATIVK